MNSLSWFLYFADVVTSVSTFLGFIVIFWMMALAGHSLFTVINNDIHRDEKNPYIRKRWFAFVILLGVVVQLIPSKNTMYAIAASELGQSAMESKLGTKAMQAIEAWIDSQIPKVVNKKD